MTKIKCGIIGFGKMGQIRANALRQSGIAEVVAIYDTTPPQGSLFPLARSEEELLADPSVDAVFVCTPNHRIADLCKDAMNAGKHVFAEKPPAFTAAQVEEVRTVEATTGKKLMYGFNHRHHGSIKRIKSIVDSGEMGRLLWMRGRYGKEVDQSYFSGWRAKPELAGGGIMLDQGIHMLDLILHLGGEFDEIHSLVSNLFWKMDGLEDNVFAIMGNSETGLCASLHSTMTQWRYLFSLEVFLEGGALILNGLKTSSGVYGDEDLAIKHNSRDSSGEFEREEHIIYHTDSSWLNEIEHFCKAILEDQPILLGNSMDALRVMRAMDRVLKRS